MADEAPTTPAPAAETPVAAAPETSFIGDAEAPAEEISTPAEPEAPAAEDKVVSPQDALYGEDEEDSGETVEEPVSEARTPESYELTLPEGVELNDEVMGEFRQFAAKENLTNEAAQGFVDLHIQEMRRLADAANRQFLETIETWQKEIASDAVLGGEKLPATRATLGRVLDEFGSKEAREAFTVTGAGDNPAIVKFIYNMAKALTEGKPVAAAAPPARKITNPVDALYGNKEPA